MGPQATEVERLLQATRLHLAQGEFQETAERAAEAIRLDGGRADAYLLRAEALRRLKKPERALADLAVAIRLDPSRPGPYVVRAEILKRRNVFDQAVADATHALTLDPRNAAAYSVRAQCRHALGDREGAADDVRAMLDVDPTRPVPSLQGSPTRGVGGEEERFWKAAAGHDPRRSGDPFADRRPADRSLAARAPVGGEALAEANDYRPEVMAALPPRRRTTTKRRGSPVGLGIGLTACLLVLVFLMSRPGTTEPVATAAATAKAADPPTRATPAIVQSATSTPSPSIARVVATSAPGPAPAATAPAAEAVVEIQSDRKALDGHTGVVMGVAFAPDGSRLASASGDGTVRLWDLGEGGGSHVVLTADEPKPVAFVAVAFSPDGRMLAASKLDGRVALWDVSEYRPKLVRSIRYHDGPVVALAFSPDGETLVTGGRNRGVLAFWEMKQPSDEPRTTLPAERNCGAWSLAFSPDGATLADGVAFPAQGGVAPPGEVWLWDVRRRPYVKRVEIKEPRKVPRSLAYSSDGSRLVFGDGDVAVVLDAATGKATGSFGGHSSFVVGVTFTPDGRRCVSASYDKTVQLWDAASMKVVRSFEGHTDAVECVAVSPDGRLAASAGHDRSIRLWRLPEVR